MGTNAIHEWPTVHALWMILKIFMLMIMLIIPESENNLTKNINLSKLWAKFFQWLYQRVLESSLWEITLTKSAGWNESRSSFNVRIRIRGMLFYLQLLLAVFQFLINNCLGVFFSWLIWNFNWKLASRSKKQTELSFTDIIT